METYRREEARHIAARIQQLCGGDTTVYDEKEKNWRTPNYGDVALLFRAASNVYLYEDALRHAGIPYNQVGGSGFYKRQEIIDIMNVLRVAADPWDEMALLGFLRGPVGGLSDESMMRLSQAGPLAEVFQSEMIPEGFAEGDLLTRARELIQSIRPQAQLPLSAFLHHVLDVTGYESMVLAQYLGVQKASNVRKLVSLAREFSRQRPPSLRAFLQYLHEIGSQNVQEGDAPLQPEEASAVTIMTISQIQRPGISNRFYSRHGPKRNGQSSRYTFSASASWHGDENHE